MATDCLISPLLAQTQTQLHLDNTTWIALVIGVCATMYVLMRARRKRKDPLEDKPHTMPLAQQRAVERQMSTLLIELSDMSREISANLDTRAAKLTALLDEADRRIAELRAANANSLPAPQLTTSEVPVTDGAEAHHAEIYELADRKMSIPDIAKRLSLPNGEVELILALRPRQRKDDRISTAV
jgi:hypothetical protein